MSEHRRTFPPRWPLALSLFLSGSAALTYQIVWVRKMTLVLGGTLDAVAIVLATFMAGLGLGGFLAGRWADRRSPSSLPAAYALVEGAIGSFALVFPFLLEALEPLYRLLYGLTGDGAVVVAVRVFTAGALLLVPTSLMGATLPLLVSYRERREPASARERTGRSAGVLYGANAFGAMAGSVLGGVVLLPALGTSTTSLLAVGANVAALGIVLVLGRARASTKPVSPERAGATFPGAGREVAVGWSVAALSGFAGLVSEVGWTRGLVLLIGPTTYGFSFVVTSVIGGLALGSAVASRWTSRSRGALALVQLAAALSSFGVSTLLGRLVLPMAGLVREQAGAPATLLGLELLLVLGLLLVPSFLLGATFPLAVALVARSDGAPGAATGSVYASNTLGAVVGSLVAGFVLVPVWGTETTLGIAAATHLAAAAAVGIVLSRRRWVPAVVAPATALAATMVVTTPTWDRELVTGGLYKYASSLEPYEFLDFVRRGDLVFDEEDRTASVTVKRIANRVSLAIDGKVDATNREDMLTQRMLGHLPLLVHPDPRDALVIGLGSGVTAASALAHPLERLDVVEISEAVVAAESWFADVNRSVLDDSRLTLHRADGRNFLLLREARYDVVISEPSNPWMAGVSSLFTREFFELARERLRPGGLFCQWAHIYNLSPGELRTVVAGFVDAFEETALFLLSESDLLLLGSAGPLPAFDEEVLRARMSARIVSSDLEEIGVVSVANVLSLYTVSTPALARWVEGAERHTDDRPILSFRAARSMHASTTEDNRMRLQRLAEDERGREEARWPEPRPSPADDVARGQMLERAESHSWAFDHFARALTTDAESLAAARGIVRTALAAGRLEEARKILRRTESVAARVGIALVEKNAGDPEAGLRALEGAIFRTPPERDAVLLAAELAGDAGRLGDMASLALRILQIDPLDPDAAALLAEVSLRAGDLAKAAEQSGAILAGEPDTTRALQVLAIASAELGRAEAARASFERLLVLEPEVPVHYNNYARFELARGDVAAAARLFERGVDVSPRNVAGYEGLLETAEALGDAERIERARSMLRALAR